MNDGVLGDPEERWPLLSDGNYGVAPDDVGWLRVHIQGPNLAGSISAPRVAIDGQPMGAEGTINDYRLRPGRHVVSVYRPGQAGRIGHAELSVFVPANGGVEVWYAPPLHVWAIGQIGLQPQQPKGRVLMGALWSCFGLLAFLGVLVVISMLLMLVTTAVAG